jgi:hypothetical protein
MNLILVPRQLDNILKNYNIPVTHDSLMTAASIFVAVAIIVAYPFNILPARVTLKMILDRMKVTQVGVRFRVLSRILRGNHQRSRSSSTDDTSTSLAQIIDNEESMTFNDETNDGLEPLLFGDDFEQSTHLPPLSLSNNDTIRNANPSSISDNTSTTEHFALTLFLSGSALIVALLIPGISVIFGLMGGTAASVISFILPGMFLKQMAEMAQVERSVRKKQRMISKIFIWGGIALGVLSTGVTLYGLL